MDAGSGDDRGRDHGVGVGSELASSSPVGVGSTGRDGDVTSSMAGYRLAYPYLGAGHAS